MATSHSLTRPQRGGQDTPVRPLPEVLPMFLHDPAVRAAFPDLHVGLLLLCRAHLLEPEILGAGSEPDLSAPHPLDRLCSALATEAGLAASVFDMDRIQGTLHVRFASGDESFEEIGGDLSRPLAGEVIFVDTAGRVHARNWAARRSPRSVLTRGVRTVLVVVQAQRPDAGPAVRGFLARLAAHLKAAGGAVETLDLGFERGVRPWPAAQRQEAAQ